MAVDLKPELRRAVQDEAESIWDDTELDEILDMALMQTNMVRQRSVRDTISLVDDQDTYSLTNVYTVVRIDLLDEDNKLIRVLSAGTWEVWGDNASSGQTIYINPRFAHEPYKIRVHGYGPYDYTTNEPDQTVQAALLALARAEALRRLASDRSRYRQWATSNPRSDTSVNELLQIINEADAEGNRLLRAIKLINRPTVGRM